MSTYEEFIQNCEKSDGVRFSWNAWPTSKIDDSRNIVPVSCLYTPFKELSTQPLPYNPIMCTKCRAILDPFCRVSYIYFCTIAMQ